MLERFPPLQYLLIVFAGGVNRQQLDVIDYLKEENRVLGEILHGQRLSFTDAQRRRLAEKVKRLGRKVVNDVASIVTPDTLLAWHRTLIAMKWDHGTGDDCRRHEGGRLAGGSDHDPAAGHRMA